MKNEDRYYEWLRPLFGQINQNSPDEYLISIAKLPRDVVTIFAAHCCDAEICNGGFLQLFYNRTGILVPEAPEGFEIVGEPGLAAVVRKATKLLGEPYPRGFEERQELMLASSGMSLDEVAEIARRSTHPYLGFGEVTKPLNFDEISTEYYKGSTRERRFFSDAAVDYLSKTGILPLSE